MSREASENPIMCSDWLALLGFLGEAEGLQFIQSQGVPPITTTEEWLKEIRSAHEVVSAISGRSSVQPLVTELGAQYEARLSQLRADPGYQEHTVGARSSTFGFVELSKIHSFQINLNSEYVESLAREAPSPDDEEGTVKFCLPMRDEVPKTPITTGYNSNTMTFSAVTQNLDLRVIRMVQAEDPDTHRPIAGFVYGFGLPQISVVEYRGFYFLKNGYHRAFALLRRGHELLPCLVISTDSYPFAGRVTPGFLPIELVTSDKSPLLSDFVSPAAVPVPRRRLRIMATIHAEVQVVLM